MLEEKILKDYQEGLKRGDSLRVSTLRFLRSALANIAIEKKKERLDDNEVIAVIRKQIKNRTEAIEQYKKGNRPDLVEKESKELEILNSYLPSPLDKEELIKLIDEVIKKLGACGLKDMGKVMKEIMVEVAGRADSSLVSQLVKEKLSLK